MADWATVENVKDVTGAVVSEADVKVAIATLEPLVGLINGVERPGISDRDKHWLRNATCFQAAFVKDNPDLFSRADVTSASQDGESASFRNVDAHLLAPLARKAIRRLSWRGLTRPGDRSRLRPSLNVNSEEYDDSLPWRPL